MKEDRFTAEAMAATEATRGTVLAATVATAASEDIRDTVSAEATATRGTVLAVTAVTAVLAATAATAASEDIRGTVLAAMAEATAATRSITIIIGTANLSDHSGKALLEQQECSSHVLAAVVRLEQNHQVHMTFL